MLSLGLVDILGHGTSIAFEAGLFVLSGHCIGSGYMGNSTSPLAILLFFGRGYIVDDWHILV